MRTVRAERTDRMLLLGRRHLERVPGEQVEHHDTHRAHRAPDLTAPADESNIISFHAARIARRLVLGGPISEYEAAARP